MTENTAPAARFTDEYMAANRIQENWNGIEDGQRDEADGPDYYVLIERTETPKTCACGCEVEVTNAKRNFLPGHDQRLMGILVRAEREGLEVSWMSGGLMISGTATDYARLVLNDAGVSKLASYIATQPKRARRTRAASNGAPVVEAPAVDPLPSTVKVGRWEYPVTGVERDANGTIVGVTYKNKRDEEITTRSWGKLA
jgi:hypothetical protein